MAYDVNVSALEETRGKDLESEAIILSRQGVLLFRVGFVELMGVNSYTVLVWVFEQP